MCAQYREKFVQLVREEGPPFNSAMDPELSDGAFVSSHDMGIANYTYAIGVELEHSEDTVVPDDCFAYVVDVKRWQKAPLGGNTIADYQRALTLVLNREPVHRNNLTETLITEAQIAPKNPHMFAIAASTMTYFTMKKVAVIELHNTLIKAGVPVPPVTPRFEELNPKHEINAGATTKFGYFLLKTPEGDKQYENRKRLSRLIVQFLLHQWHEERVMRRSILHFYQSKNITGKDKQDDYADAFLMMYTELCIRRKIRPTWAALEKLYSFLREDKHFADDGSWPLALTADGARMLQVEKNRVEREARSALKHKEKEETRLKNPKRKRSGKNDVDEIKKLSLLEQTVNEKLASVAAVASLSSAAAAKQAQAKHKAERPAQRIAERAERAELEKQQKKLAEDLARKEVLSERDIALIEGGATGMQYYSAKEMLTVRRADEKRLRYLTIDDAERDEVAEQYEELRREAIKAGLSDADRLMAEAAGQPIQIDD